MVPVANESVGETFQENVRSYRLQVLERKPPLSTSLPPQRDTLIRGALVLGSAHHARSRAFGRSGIGLTIAQSLVQAMSCDIRVESVGLGQGSSFTFALPQAHE